MEQIRAELVRFANELDTVTSQVQTECNGLRNFFTRVTVAASSQQGRRLNHRDAERHLGSRVHYGGFAFRIKGCAAALSHGRQGGELLREAAKRDKFNSNAVGTWMHRTATFNS